MNSRQHWKKLENASLSTKAAPRKRTENHVAKFYELQGYDPPLMVWSDSPLIGGISAAIASQCDPWWQKMQGSELNIRRHYHGPNFYLNHLRRSRTSGWRASNLVNGMWQTTRRTIQHINRDEMRQGQLHRLRAKYFSEKVWQGVEQNIATMQVRTHRAWYKHIHAFQHWDQFQAPHIVMLPYYHEAWEMRVPDYFEKLWRQLLATYSKIFEATRWYYFKRDIAFLCENPIAIHQEQFSMDEPPVLHNAHGPALEWKDGFKVWVWRGRFVPQSWREKPITINNIMSERNGENRRIKLQMYGLANYITDVQTDGLGWWITRQAQDKWGELYILHFNGDDSISCVMVKNTTPNPDGTRTKYALAVPPDCRKPEHGLLAIHGMRDTAQYRPIQES